MPTKQCKSQYRDLRVLRTGDCRILVRRGGDLQTTDVLVVHEPAPATALHARSGSIETLNEAIEIAKLLIQGLGKQSAPIAARFSQRPYGGESTGRGSPAAALRGREVRPEDAMVNVAAAFQVSKRANFA